MHKQVIEKIIEFSLELGYDIEHLTYSPITGGEGNIEFLVHLHWEGSKEEGKNNLTITIDDVVEMAHIQLKKEN